MNTHKNKKKDDNELYLKKGFEAGVTMALLSVGKFESEEDNPKLKEVIERLWSEFVSVIKHRKKVDSNAETK